MAHTPQRPDRRNRGDASATPRRRAAAQTAGEPPREGRRPPAAEKGEASGQAAPEARRRGEAAVAEAVKQTLQAGAGTARAARRAAQGAEATGQAGTEPHHAAAPVAGEPPRRGEDEAAAMSGQAATEAQRHGEVAVAEAVKQTLQAGTGTARAARQAGTDIARRTSGEAPGAEAAPATAMEHAPMPPGLPAAMLFGMPQAYAGLLSDMLQTHLRLGQDMLRLANPLALIEMQQQVLRSYLDLLLSGRHALDSAAQAAERAREAEPEA